ncbi:MAG: penicillin-binding protein 2 [Candidatus Zixiibacteriota bacterium]|nr:MAG: penicillin-binding protein 2 [candidate division Zixibacteria bacterium]
MDRFKISLESRRFLTFIIISLVFLLIFIGLFNLQVVKHKTLLLKSENNRLRVVPIIPRRGRVYDREGKVIIDNRPSYTVSVILSEQVKGVTVPKLAELLEMDTSMVRKRIKKNYVSRYQATPIKRDVPFNVIAVLEEQNSSYPGIVYQMERVRQYKNELNAESFTGYVGEVSESDLKNRTEIDYRLGSLIGKKGIEKQYDNILRGLEGTEYEEVTAFGQNMGKSEEKETNQSVSGADLYLTIDNDLQLACTEAIDTFCCGTIIAMNPRNGEILALISYPTYDANIFSSVIPESLWNEIRSDSTHPLLNRPINGLYPPASTAKLIALGAGLEGGIITESSTFSSCVGGYQFGDRYFKCWKPEGHGVLKGVNAIEQSCDVYFYQLGLKLGVDELSNYYDLCGFGKITNIDIPNESKGLNPNSEYYDKRYGKNKWTRGLVLNNVIGQGEILVNIIQLAQFYCGIANNGIVYRPHLLKKVIYSDNKIQETTPIESFRLPFKQKTIDVLKEGVRLVVEGEHGTARFLQNDQFTLGGKTGTAQNPHGENHSWFASIAPLDNPEIVVVVLVENAGHGSEVAAPLAGKILKTYFDKKEGNLPVVMSESKEEVN